MTEPGAFSGANAGLNVRFYGRPGAIQAEPKADGEYLGIALLSEIHTIAVTRARPGGSSAIRGAK